MRHNNVLNVFLLLLFPVPTSSFVPLYHRYTASSGNSPPNRKADGSKNHNNILPSHTLPPLSTSHTPPSSSVPLPSKLAPDDDDDETAGGATAPLAESDKLLLGVASTTAGAVTLYSEYVLGTTGCGLPAGPFGLVGAVEGVSYLGIVGMGGFSLYRKIKTGSGLPSGPGGILGLGEGLSFLSILVGLVVLVLQITNFGYIPNAVPMEGGMCS